MATRLGPGTLAALGLAFGGHATAEQKTSVTIWAPAPTAIASMEYGGGEYGGYTPTTGAFVIERREVDVGNAEVRVAVPATIDAASVHVRDLTDPAGVLVTEQRFVPATRTPTEMIARQVGQQITVATAKGETIAGTLRGVDELTLVIEVAGAIHILRRENLADVKLAASAPTDRPTLAWKLSSKKPGKHEIEVGYRADGLAWSADYTAILDESGTSLDFRAWATIKNQTGGTFDNAHVTLVSGATTISALNPYMVALAPAPPQRFTLPAPIKLGNNETIQVELVPAKLGIKPKQVVAFEAMTDPSADYQQYPNTDCSQFNGQGMDPGTTQLTLDVELPAGVSLPPGRVRLFHRKPGGHVDAVSEDDIAAQSGSARIKLAHDKSITGERLQTDCDVDEAKRILRETIEIKLANTAKKPLEVVAREYMWRSTMWKVENDKNRPPSGQTHEFRTTVPAGGKASLKYVVVYTWN